MTNLHIVLLAAGGWSAPAALYLAYFAVDRAADHSAPLTVAALLLTFRLLGGHHAR